MLFYSTQDGMQIIGRDFYGLPGSLKGIAQLYETIGEIDKAKEFLTFLLIVAKYIADKGSSSELQNHTIIDLFYVTFLVVNFYVRQAEYTEAEALCKEWIKVQGAIARADDEYMTEFLIEQLAELYILQRKYADAEPLYHRILSRAKNEVMPDFRLERRILGILSLLYKCLGRYAESEALSQQANWIQSEK